MELDIPGYSLDNCRKEFAGNNQFYKEGNIYDGIRLHVQSGSCYLKFNQLLRISLCSHF